MANPRLRFKRDDGTDYPDWEEKKLSYYLEVNKDKNKDYYYDKNDVLSVSGEYGIVNQIKFQGRSFAGADLKNYRVVYKDNIVYTKSPLKNNPYGIIKYNSGVNGIVSTLYAVYFCKDNVNGKVIEYYFGLDSRLNNYLRTLVNIGAKHDMKINDEKVISSNICLPCIEEQQKIVDFLSDIDEVILTTSQEIKKLEELKKGVMQKIFSQEVRFKQDDGTDYPDWEEKKLTEQADFLQGLTYSPDDVSKNGTLVLRSSNIQNDFISHEDEVYVNIDIPNKLKVKENDILMCVRNGSKKLVGKTALITKKEIGSSWGAFMMIIRPKCNTLFLYQYFKTDFFRKQIFNDLNTATINQITKNNINGCKLFLPCLEEQQKIADCLSAFDEAILLSKQELDKWKLLKKGFLQQMFV